MSKILQYLSLDKLLEILETANWSYRIVVWLWGFVPRPLRYYVLRLVNPSVTLGAVAIISDPYSPATDPKVLLGWHTYHARVGTPWALLGGALKKRDQEVTEFTHAGIPGQAVIREIFEETGLDIEVVKLLAIDTDWNQRTMDFYFECALRRGEPDLSAPLPNPEISKLAWFRVSELPENMYYQHKRFLTQVLPTIPRLPGVSWTSNQQPPIWWNRFYRAEQIRRKLQSSPQEPRLALATLINEARTILNCEVVSLFIAEPPIQIVAPEYDLPTDIQGRLRLQTEAHQRRGTLTSPKPVILPLTQPDIKKLGLTAWLVRARPLGRAIRLHEDWLHNHDHVKSWRDHDHLDERVCHSMAAVAIVSQSQVLGLIKAENKVREDNRGSNIFVPFGPDDGNILEEFAIAAVPLLEELTSKGKDGA